MTKEEQIMYIRKQLTQNPPSIEEGFDKIARKGLYLYIDALEHKLAEIYDIIDLMKVNNK